MINTKIFLVFITAISQISPSPPCFEVTISECALDDAYITYEKRFELESQCRAFCDFVSVFEECTFSIWSPKEPANCVTYWEPFAQYVGHCQLIGGPKYDTGCTITEPEDNSCHVFREGDCTYDGGIQEVLNTPSIDVCWQACSINPLCKAWTFREEPRLECILYNTEEMHCFSSYSPSQISWDICDIDDDPDVFLVTGGFGDDGDSSMTSEVLGHPDCSVPDIYTAFPGQTNVLTADGLILYCGGGDYSDSKGCWQLTGQGWIFHSTTIWRKKNALAVSLPSGVFLIGGNADQQTSRVTEFLPTGTKEWHEEPLDSNLGSPLVVGYGTGVVAISDHQFLLFGNIPTPWQLKAYDIETSSWTMWPSLPANPRYSGSARIGDNVIIAGGDSMKVTIVVNIVEKTSRLATGMNVPRKLFAMVTLNGYVVAAGGESKVAEKWDKEKEEWVIMEDQLQEQRGGLGFVAAPKSNICF